ncbi:hypothetical protein MLD38_022469 [Melastoma candidum]|nr:hypothetical protein MLD38_022469 [Melastoma candidum]
MPKSSAKSRNGVNLDGLDYEGFFDLRSKHKPGFGVNNDVGNDIFGRISSSLTSSGHKGTAAGPDDSDIFGSQVGDLLGGFVSSNSSGFSRSNGSGSVKRTSGNNVGLGDDLIPGLGGTTVVLQGVALESGSKPVHSATGPLEEFNQFTEFKSPKHNLPKCTNSPRNGSSIDELEEFAKGRPKDIAGGPEPDILFSGKEGMSKKSDIGFLRILLLR